jgi:hypothetical protein
MWGVIDFMVRIGVVVFMVSLSVRLFFLVFQSFEWLEEKLKK